MYLPSSSQAVVWAIGILYCCAGCWKNSPSGEPSTRPATQPATPLARFDYLQYRMGMRARMVVYAKDRDAADEAARAAYRRVTELELAASDYRKDSELMRLCAAAGGPPVKISDDLFTLLQTSCEVSRRSDGAFDCTCGPLVRLWREARKTKQLPKQQQIDAALKLVGWRKIKLDATNHTAQLLQPGMLLDLGGIAKGYAGDCVMAVLRQHGVNSALFEIGGDIVVSDAPPDSPAGWDIGIMPEGGSDKERMVSISNCGISTSGDTFQFVEVGGRHYSHVIDPRTGWALTSRRMTTIIAPQGIISDALSTATDVLEPDQARALVKTYPHTRIYIGKSVDPQNTKTRE